METGEENETTEYTCRAKLYNFVSSNPSDASSKKEWKERGLGTLRLNVQNSPNADVEAGAAAAASKSDTHDSNDEGKVRARLVMRADGSHRVVLNTPIKKELRFGSVTGGAPQGGFVYFMGSVDGSAKLELLQLKVRLNDFAPQRVLWACWCGMGLTCDRCGSSLRWSFMSILRGCRRLCERLTGLVRGEIIELDLLC